MNIKKLKAWITLSRLPFHTVGIFPFILGNVLAWYNTGVIDWTVLFWGTLCVALILSATYYSGEYYDYETDNLSSELGRNRFTGGSQVIQSGLIPRHHALIASLVSVSAALVIGFILHFYYDTGAFTLPLGIIGILGGLFYSAKPVQWAYKGLGEIWIGFCYGWLTVAASYYLQTGKFPNIIHWTSLPIIFSIFNVILINEFPDYLADKRTGKQNLVVRFGKSKMSKIYIIFSIGIWISYLIAIWAGIPLKALIFFLPVFILSLITIIQVFKKHYKEHKALENICAKTLIINLGVSVSFILAICF
ncbi:hypothetical protein GF312_18770 [Candidatus Poribacteria bacterium]|nr:hypothetical protein [Candidatus Poribacteria bacterium]